MVVTVALPLGDITANQLRSLADIVRKFTRETIRTTVEQNFVIRWVSLSDLPAIYKALEAAELAAPGAGTIVDIVTCPGTDTCKLGISSSRGLAAELRKEMLETGAKYDQAVESLHIKISGCYNSCGQHHVADLGFYGVSRKIGNFAVPHFQVVLGGEWEHNAGSYGLARRCRSVEKYSQGGYAPHRALSRRPHRRRNLPEFRQAHRQGRNEKHARRSRQAARRRPLLLSATGAIPANTP